MKFKFNLEGVAFDLKGKENDAFGGEKLNFDLQGHIGKMEIEAEASIEEMIKEVIPHLRGAIEASIKNEKK